MSDKKEDFTKRISDLLYSTKSTYDLQLTINTILAILNEIINDNKKFVKQSKNYLYLLKIINLK